MNYIRLLPRSVRKVVQSQVRRHSSEQQYWKDEPKINTLSLAVCTAITGYVCYDIINDRKAHAQVFAANYDESKSYFTRDGQINMSFKPNMDFIMDNVYQVPKGDGEEQTDILDTMMSENNPDWAKRIENRQ